MKNLGRGGIVGAGDAAADVGLMRTVAHKGKDLAVDEDWAAHHPIGKMIAAGDVRVARDEDVTWRNVVEAAQDSLDNHTAAARVDGNAVRLADEAAAAVGQKAGEVMALVENWAAGGPQHDLAHALGDMIDTLLHERQRDGVEPRRGDHGHGLRARANAFAANDVVGQSIDAADIAWRQHHAGGRLLDNGGSADFGAGFEVSPPVNVG